MLLLRGWAAAVLLCVMFPGRGWAQDEPEYRLEVGAALGAANYLGDYNGSLLSDMQPWGALVAKYRMNPRMALALTVGFGKLKGSSADVDTWYPAEPYAFSNGLIDAGLRFEYNFWAFGTGREYRGARRFTPFLTLGLGATHHGGQESHLTANLPLGAGVKYKLADRVNLAAEWRMHFCASDYLDDVVDPYGIKSSGLFKNSDCYSVLQLALTYDIWAKCKTCNNDRY